MFLKKSRQRYIMAKKITVLLFVVLLIAAGTSLCRGWGEEAIKDAMDKAKLGAEEAKEGASEAMQDAKDKTGSWADLASDKFSEEFGWGENDVKDGTRRLMSEATDAVNAAADKARRYTFQTACELADMIRQRNGNGHGHGNGNDNDNNREAYEFITKKLGEAYDILSNLGNQPIKTFSRKAADEALKKFVGNFFDAMDMWETIRPHGKYRRPNRDYSYRAEDEKAEKSWKTSHMKADIIKSVLEDDISDDKLMLIFGKDGSELLKKYKEANSNVQETYKAAMETMTQEAKDRYEEAKEKASQAAAEFGRSF